MRDHRRSEFSGVLPAMLADLEDLVRCESFSADHPALAHSADVVGAMGTRLLGAEPELIVLDGVPHLRWTFGTPRVLLLGHHDTVWPRGSLLNGLALRDQQDTVGSEAVDL